MPADGWYEWLPVDGRKQPHSLWREDRGGHLERASRRQALLCHPYRACAWPWIKETHSRMRWTWAPREPWMRLAPNRP
ncbi:hypothetical protein [Chromohalobacter israelensis]|uniref:hypothetical protein n=1 Tax=Chromohalobacter israelensis TaxID=141390 RepID=UPI00295F475E|nr:hypothetical protein [Chromohalobacter salexigens]